MNYYDRDSSEVKFNTLSGELIVYKNGDMLELDFPTYEFVSRSFCPKLSIPEDPVCGSAHCQIADYWAKELGKEEIYAYQASARSGYLKCKILGNKRIAISGHAALIAISELQLG